MRSSFLFSLWALDASSQQAVRPMGPAKLGHARPCARGDGKAGLAVDAGPTRRIWIHRKVLGPGVESENLEHYRVAPLSESKCECKQCGRHGRSCVRMCRTLPHADRVTGFRRGIVAPAQYSTLRLRVYAIPLYTRFSLSLCLSLRYLSPSVVRWDSPLLCAASASLSTAHPIQIRLAGLPK